MLVTLFCIIIEKFVLIMLPLAKKMGPKRLYSSFENKSLGGASESQLFLQISHSLCAISSKLSMSAAVCSPGTDHPVG